MASRRGNTRKLVYLDPNVRINGLIHDPFVSRRKGGQAYSVFEQGQFQLYLPFVTEAPRAPIALRSSAAHLLGLLMSHGQRDAFIGDLEERYGVIARAKNRRAATAWFWREVAHSLFSLAIVALKKVSGLENLLRRIGS
jgi:hypothetical protein